MFRFENPDYLYFLLLIPLLSVGFFFVMRYRKILLARLGEHHLISRLTLGLSKYKHTVKFGLLMTGLLFLIIGLANPQWGAKTISGKAQGVDIFMAMDISQSMLAEDVRPNRMERAKKFAQDFIRTRAVDRVGLIVFAGNAFLQMPLTSDKSAAGLFLKTADPSMAPSQGTAIAEAIKTAEESFGEESGNSKVLIVITDGENHDDETISAAKQAAANGMTIFSVGVGTQEGGFFPDINTGRREYKRDRSGQPVRSRLNEEMIQNLANAGEGKSYLLTDTDAVVEALDEEIAKVEKRDFEEQSYTEYESHFSIFLIIALMLLLAEFFVSYRKNAALAGKDLFG